MWLKQNFLWKCEGGGGRELVFLSDLLFLIVCIHSCVSVYGCVQLAALARRGHWNPDFGVTRVCEQPYMGAGNPTQVFWKSSKQA